MRRDCRTCKHGDEPLNSKSCGSCTMFDKYEEEDDMGEKIYQVTFRAGEDDVKTFTTDEVDEGFIKRIMGEEDDDLQEKLDEANAKIGELDRKLRAAQIELATMRGTIEGLKFSIRCNGVSGAEVR